MGKSIRVKTLEEFERFKKIIFDESISPYLFRDVHTTKTNSENIKEEDLMKDMFCYLFEEDGKDIGMAAGYLLKPINKMIVDVGVLPEYYGKFTKEYVSECLKEFYSYTENKGVEIWGYVKEQNKRCLKFSEKMGFEVFKLIYGNYILRYNYEWN
jgi:ribosomal protein S18 acetylase RimI-like enzyme